MTGSAVETTRLSSEAMKSARPVMTTAHTALLRTALLPTAGWAGASVRSEPVGRAGRVPGRCRRSEAVRHPRAAEGAEPRVLSCD